MLNYKSSLYTVIWLLGCYPTPDSNIAQGLCGADVTKDFSVVGDMAVQKPFSCIAAKGQSGEGLYCSDIDFMGTTFPANWSTVNSNNANCWLKPAGELDLNSAIVGSAMSYLCNAQLPHMNNIATYKTITVSLIHEISIDTSGVTTNGGTNNLPPQVQLAYDGIPLLAITNVKAVGRLSQLVWTSDVSSLPPGGPKDFALAYYANALAAPTTAPIWKIKSVAVMGSK